jgi:glycerol kinase
VTAILVLDLGTTSMRAAIVDDELAVVDVEARRMPPETPFPGLVEFDAAAMAAAAIEAATVVVERTDEPPRAVGITNQRASTVVWDRATGEPIGPGIGWQDLRTVLDCITAKSEHGLTLAPNQSATKLAWLLNNVPGARERDLCFGTVDCWLAWTLSRGTVHVTDHTNATLTGLTAGDHTSWSEEIASLFDIARSMLPTVVSSSGVVGEAVALPASPPIAALIGDQQGSLVGQGCVRPGLAKITFGTGGMLDVCTGPAVPASALRSANGTFPIVAWSADGKLTWGAEAIMLSAGTNIDWLCDDLGLIESPAASEAVAMSVAGTDGVIYVPALLGLGTPRWDFGARGTLLGVTRGTTAAHVVRAVLDGVAQRGTDLVDATETDTGLTIGSLRVDGGMSGNPVFVQALADLARRPVEVAPVADATMLGAAFLAGLAVGVWGDIDDAASLWRPPRIVEPATDRSADRDSWSAAVDRSAGWIPELSALDF